MLTSRLCYFTRADINCPLARYKSSRTNSTTESDTGCCGHMEPPRARVSVWRALSPRAQFSFARVHFSSTRSQGSSARSKWNSARSMKMCFTIWGGYQGSHCPLVIGHFQRGHTHTDFLVPWLTASFNWTTFVYLREVGTPCDQNMNKNIVIRLCCVCADLCRKNHNLCRYGFWYISHYILWAVTSLSTPSNSKSLQSSLGRLFYVCAHLCR